MVASMDLGNKLQKITALMGLLRSDLLELSQTKDAMLRGLVFQHVNWIADKLDAMAAGLADSADERPAAPHRKSSRETPPDSSAGSDEAREAMPSAPEDAKQPDDPGPPDESLSNSAAEPIPDVPSRPEDDSPR